MASIVFENLCTPTLHFQNCASYFTYVRKNQLDEHFFLINYFSYIILYMFQTNKFIIMHVCDVSSLTRYGWSSSNHNI